MDTATARTLPLIFTSAALESITAAGKTTDDLSRAAEQAISDPGAWIAACETWAEAAFDMWIPLEGSRFAGRFVNFMARFGGPDEPNLDLIPRQIVIMTLDEARS